MKKLLVMIALLGLPSAVLTGCGGSENKIVEGELENPSMTSDQMSEYEAQMRGGGATSSRQSGSGAGAGN